MAHYLHRPGPLLHDVGFDWLPVVIATCLSLLWFVFCLLSFFFPFFLVICGIDRGWTPLLIFVRGGGGFVVDVLFRSSEEIILTSAKPCSPLFLLLSLWYPLTPPACFPSRILV